MPRYHRYLFIFMLVALIPVLVVISANSVGFLLHRQTPGSDILNRQITKLERSGDIDLLLLGDSSLQAAVDDTVLSDLLGQNVRNLALTGVWGYAGSLAMLERVLERQRQPPHIMLVHTSDMFGRETSDFGFLMASHHPITTLLTDLDVIAAMRDNLTSAKNFKKWFRAWRRAFLADDASKAATGQKTSIRDELFNMSLSDREQFMREDLNISRINPAKTKYLKRLAALCQAHDLQCLYAHGPIARPFLEDVRHFHEEANPMIEALGFRLLPSTPMPIEYADLGDTEDHVAPEAKDRFTRRFADLLSPYLKPDPSSSPPIVAERPI